MKGKQKNISIDRLKPAYECTPPLDSPTLLAPLTSASPHIPLPSQEETFAAATNSREPLLAKKRGRPRKSAARQTRKFGQFSDRSDTTRTVQSPSDSIMPYRSALLSGLPLLTGPSRPRSGQTFSRASQNHTD